MGQFKRLRKLSSWRRISLNAWDAPGDPTAYGMLDIDVSSAQAYLDDARARSGVKVTLTHLVGKAVAMAIAERPEVNAVIRRRHAVYQRQSIDVFFQVALDAGEDLSGAKVTGVDTRPLLDIARELGRRALRVREHRDRELTGNSRLMARLPLPVAGALMGLAGAIQYDLGVDLSRLGLPGDAFGTVMVTNVGVFGLPKGLAPLVPFSRAPMVLTLGAVEPRPWAVGDRVEVRPVLTIGATLDHRLFDGFQAGRVAARFHEILEDPAGNLPED